MQPSLLYSSAECGRYLFKRLFWDDGISKFLALFRIVSDLGVVCPDWEQTIYMEERLVQIKKFEELSRGSGK